MLSNSIRILATTLAALLAGGCGGGDASSEPLMDEAQHSHYHVHALDASHGHSHAAGTLGGHEHMHQHTH